MVRIYIDDLIPNAFIAYLQHTNPKNLNRKLNLHQIEKFGQQVIDNLKRKKIDAYLILSRDLTNEFFSKYYDWFRLQDDDFVALDDYVTINNLIDRFTGYLSVDLLIEFGKRKNYKILLA